jgi:hypothetical protein
MYPKEMPLFKELMPYSGQIDAENRWVKMAEMLPWDELDGIYRRYFDDRRQGVIKKCRLITGLMVGQMILEMSDREIVSFFHENPYFQYFCGQDTFVARLNRRVIHPSLLSKRRRRLGIEYMNAFEAEVLKVLIQNGVVKGKKLMLDATVFEANITYPNDVKLLNTVREWCCHTILNVKNGLDPKQKIRTMRRAARNVYLQYQKTRRKTDAYIRKTRNRMLRFTNRNMAQLELLVEKAKSMAESFSVSILQKIEARLAVAKLIYDQQLTMSKTRGKRVANRIVSFHQPLVRPMIRGKEGGNYEFGIKAHVALVDGYGFLDSASFDSFHEGNLLPDSVAQHSQRFGKLPRIVIADQLYATRSNRTFLKDQQIHHAFKSIGRPPNIPEKTVRLERASRKKHQVSRNAIEGLFGHLKSRFNLNRTTWTVPNGPEFQVRLGLIAFNLHRATSNA